MSFPAPIRCTRDNTPPLIEFNVQPTALIQLTISAYLHFHLGRMADDQQRMMYRLARSIPFFIVLLTIAGAIFSTRVDEAIAQ